MIFIRETQFKANLHCHSVFSDGVLTPEQLKELYKGQGYSILCISDHDHPLDHTDLSDSDFLLLTGYEAYLRRTADGRHNGWLPEVHMNLFARDPHNIDQIWPDPRYMKYYRGSAEKANHPTYGPSTPRGFDPDSVNEFIRLAQEDGYLVVYNHPVWSLEGPDEVLKYKGLLSLELVNGGSLCCGLPEYNAALYDHMLQQGARLYVHSADDNHNREPLFHPGSDSFQAFTYFNLPDDELSYGGVIRALEDGTFYSSMGPQIRRLEIADGRAIIDTTPAARIAMITNGQRSAALFPENFGETVCHAEFELFPEAKYIRFNVMDDAGRFADTRAFYPEEYV